MASLKELSVKQDLLSGGHRMCAGCAAPIAVRQILLSSKLPVVVTCATGCLEVSTTIFPYSAWKVPFIHSAFENAAATISGIETAYKALSKKGKIKDNIKFIAFGGDGGTYDIGFQALSGMLERRHSCLYVCYNNEAYMNTGIQRSSATPYGASTTTAPAGKIIPGKQQFKKDLTECIVAHNVPYVAQTVVGFWNDLVKKVEKALSFEGPTFINILAPCRLGWGFPSEELLNIGRLSVDTCYWPLYEVENGEYRITHFPKEKKPIKEWLQIQARFNHLIKGKKDDIIEQIQLEIDNRWKKLQEKC